MVKLQLFQHFTPVFKILVRTLYHLSTAGYGGTVRCTSELSGCRFDPRQVQQLFMEIDLEMFSTVILSLLLIQEGQLSVSGKKKLAQNTG